MNRRGATIVEILIGASALVALSAAFAGLLSSTNSDLKKLENFHKANLLHNKMTRHLSVRSTCSATFKNFPPSNNPAITRIVDGKALGGGPENIIFSRGATYEKDLILVSLQGKNFTPDATEPTEASFELSVTYQFKGAPLAPQTPTITKTILLNSKTTANGFECFSVGDIGTDAEYVKEMGSDTLLGDLTENGALTINGPVIADEFLQGSDSRLKKNITSISNLDSKINALAGYSYKRHGDTKNHFGFVAQDLAQTTPLTEKNKSNILKVKYLGAIPIALEASKEVSKKQSTLKKELHHESQKMKLILEELREHQF